MKKINIYTICLLTILFIFAHSAFAHDMWIEMRDYTPAKTDEITMTLAYGHHFPARDFMDNDRLEKIYMLSPDGTQLTVTPYSENEYKLEKPLGKEGTAMVVAMQKAGFSTKTTEGYQRGKSKKGLKNVIYCTYSAKFSKAIVNTGTPGGSVVMKKLGHELEIVPLADPGTLSQGDTMPILVLYKGEPVRSSFVYSTYLGFSTEKNTFAYTTKTDKEGKAAIKMIQSGVWLVTTSYEEKYPDAAECDNYKFSATMTFEVK